MAGSGTICHTKIIPESDKYHKIRLKHIGTLHPKTFIMKANMGATDRAIRVAAAIFAAILYLTNIVTGSAGIVLLVIAAVFLLTSLISFCPLYTILGINTCHKK